MKNANFKHFTFLKSIPVFIMVFLLSIFSPVLNIIPQNIIPNTVKVEATNSPTWWNGNCDVNNHGGSYADGGAYNSVITCSPGPYYGGTQYTPTFKDAQGNNLLNSPTEWFCTELAMRYMLLVYGVNPYLANGSQVVSALPSSDNNIMAKVYNGQGQLPVAGDIMSYGTANNPNDPNNAGHTAIVTAASSSAISVMQENAGQYYSQTEPISNGIVQPLSGNSSKTVEGWLHYVGGVTPPSLKVQNGVNIPPSQPIVMNQQMSGSFTVVNNGSDDFYIRSLGLFAQDSSGHPQFLIYQDNTGSDIYVGKNGRTRTLNGNVGNFAYNCQSCNNGGSYNIIAEYQDPGSDSNAWHQIGVTGSGVNPLPTNVGTPASLTVTSGISVPGSFITTGDSFGSYNNESFTVKNTGSVGYSLGQLTLSLNGGPNNINCDIASDGSYNGSNNIIPAGGSRTLTINISSFALGCGNDYSGTYKFSENWQDGNGDHPIAYSSSFTLNDEDNYSEGRLSDGRLMLFTKGQDERMYYAYETTVNGSLSSWNLLTSQTDVWFSGKPVVGTNSDGRLEVFARARDNRLWHVSEIAPGSNSFNSWGLLNQSGQQIVGDPAVTLNSNGDLNVFIRDTSNNLQQRVQNTPGGSYSSTDPGSNWADWFGTVSGPLASDTVAYTQPNGIELLYALGFDNHIHVAYQSSPSGSFVGWNMAADQTNVTFSGTPVIGINQDGRMELFGRGTDSRLWHVSQSSVNGGFNAWASLNIPGAQIQGDPGVSIDSNGELNVFIRNTGNILYYKHQNVAGGGYSSSDPGSNWTDWSSLDDGSGRQFTSDAIAGINTDGHIDVYEKSTDSSLWHENSLLPTGSGWSSWSSLNEYIF